LQDPEDGTAECVAPPPPMVRIAADSTTNTGRLEFLWNGSYGTVCQDGFGAQETDVACRELGFETGVALFKSAEDDGVLPTVLGDLGCVETESSLADCPSREAGKHDCGHGEDV
jgi:hypothetical protein